MFEYNKGVHVSSKCQGLINLTALLMTCKKFYIKYKLK